MTTETFLPHPLFPHRLVGTKGTLISTHMGRRRVLLTRPDPKTGYMIGSVFPIMGQAVRQYLHRLVAQTHIPNPHNLPEVNHIDHDKANNCVENLEWISHADNLKKARLFHGNWTTGEKVRKPIIATPINGGHPVRWESGRAWALASGNYKRAANISSALRTGKAAYGYYWTFANPSTPTT